MSRPHPATELDAINQLRGLGISMARDLIHQEADFEDIDQEIAIASIEAYRRFDPSKNAAISTFARWRHRGALTRLRERRGRGPLIHQSEDLDLIPRDRPREPDAELCRIVEQAVSQLSPSHEKVVRLWYGIGCEAVPDAKLGGKILGLRPRSYTTLRYQAVRRLKEIVTEMQEAAC